MIYDIFILLVKRCLCQCAFRSIAVLILERISFRLNEASHIQDRRYTPTLPLASLKPHRKSQIKALSKCHVMARPQLSPWTSAFQHRFKP